MTLTTKLQRATCYAIMIEDCDSLLHNLSEDISKYENPDPAFDKFRLMLSYEWTRNKIRKYENIKNRLEQSLMNLVANVAGRQAA